jgi:hypothetical protein
MNNIVMFRPKVCSVGLNHRCPFCGGWDGFVNIRAQQWAICDRHRVKWYLGSNLTDDWMQETQRDWTANAHYLDTLDRVYPDDAREQA